MKTSDSNTYDRKISPLGEAVIECLYDVGYKEIAIEKTEGGERFLGVPGWEIEVVPHGGVYAAAEAFVCLKEKIQRDDKYVAIIWFDYSASNEDIGINVFLGFEDIHDVVREIFSGGLKASKPEKEWVKDLLQNEGRCYRIRGDYLGCRAYTPLEDWLLLMTRWKLYGGGRDTNAPENEPIEVQRSEYPERYYVQQINGRLMRVVDYGSYRERQVILEVEEQIRVFGRPIVASSMSREDDFVFAGSDSSIEDVDESEKDKESDSAEEESI